MVVVLIPQQLHQQVAPRPSQTRVFGVQGEGSEFRVQGSGFSGHSWDTRTCTAN